MAKRLKDLIRALPQFFAFLFRVMRGFRQNQGMLLSGAIAFYTLLSIAPLSILTLIVLSHFVQEEQLFLTLSTYLEMAMPGYASTLIEQVRTFFAHRKVIGVIGILIMLFFSSAAFTVLENAISVIFHHRIKIQRRHFIISAIIPYVYILLIGLGIFFVSFFAGAFEAIESRHFILLGWNWSFEGTSRIVFYWSGLIGEVLDVYISISRHACWTDNFPSRTPGRIGRHDPLGDNPSHRRLVLQISILRKYNLRLPGLNSSISSQCGGSSDNPALGSPGYCRARKQT